MSYVQTVYVWDKPYKITVDQQIEIGLGCAEGDYEGQSIEGKGASMGAAVIRWRETAQYRGNG